MIRPSEFQILLLAIAVIPLIAWTYGSVDLPGKRWFAVALVSLLGAYLATVAEGFAAGAALNTLEHALYALSAVCFAAATLQLLRLRHYRSERT